MFSRFTRLQIGMHPKNQYRSLIPSMLGTIRENALNGTAFFTFLRARCQARGKTSG